MLHFCFDLNALLTGWLRIRIVAVGPKLPRMRPDLSEIMAHFALIPSLAGRRSRERDPVRAHLRHEILGRKIGRFKKITWRNPHA
jgi:hypothetical protein